MTTDSEINIQFFAAQKKVEPRAVKGRYRSLKWLVMGLGLLIYYGIPFLRWHRGANVPDQAILLDLSEQRGYFFTFEIWPQEVYYLTGVLVCAAIALFFSTALFGRVWCGYLCFQTVWTDLYRFVENLIQGDRNARMRRDKTPWAFDRLWRKGLTHILWVFIAAITGGAFVLYFNDAPTVVKQILSFSLEWDVLMWVVILTASTYIMAGYAREQVCTYMCPYARFQSAMFDEHSLIISYDRVRGEPRGKKTEFGTNGHCVDCSLCVQVCPVGIDIRNGLQLECIACGLCVDACNGVMEKLSLPKGLIRYDTAYNINARAKGLPEKFKFMRTRTLYYAGVLVFVLGLMLYGQFNRKAFELHAIHDRNPLFVMLADGSIRNGYDLKILNKTHEQQTFTVGVAGLENAVVTIQDEGGVTAQIVQVKADAVTKLRAFVTAEEQPVAKKDIVFTLKRADGAETAHESVFVSTNDAGGE